MDEQQAEGAVDDVERWLDALESLASGWMLVVGMNAFPNLLPAEYALVLRNAFDALVAVSEVVDRLRPHARAIVDGGIRDGKYDLVKSETGVVVQ